jgi:hypothetical protein
MWGCYTHCYVAFPLFPAPRGTVLTAASPDEMAAKMRRAEQTGGVQVPQQGPPPDWRGAPARPGPGPQDWAGPGRQGWAGPGAQGWPGQGAPDWPGRQ